VDGLVAEWPVEAIVVFVAVVGILVLFGVSMMLWISEERILREIRELDRKIRLLSDRISR